MYFCLEISDLLLQGENIIRDSELICIIEAHKNMKKQNNNNYVKKLNLCVVSTQQEMHFRFNRDY